VNIVDKIVEEFQAPENYDACWGCVLLDSCMTHKLRCDASLRALLTGKKTWELKLPTPKTTLRKGV